MKYLALVVALLLGGLFVGCAPAVSQASRAATVGGNGADVKPTLTETIPTALVSVTSTGTPATGPTLTPTLSTTPSPTATPTPVTPSPVPVKLADTSMPSPTFTALPPTATAGPTVGIDSAAQSTVKDGLQLYREQGCGNCHQLDVAGTQGTLGPPHNGIATTAEARIHAPDYTGTATSPAEYLRESIVNPGIYLVSGYNSPRLKMAAFTNLSEAEVDALVQFLLQQ